MVHSLLQPEGPALPVLITGRLCRPAAHMTVFLEMAWGGQQLPLGDEIGKSSQRLV